MAESVRFPKKTFEEEEEEEDESSSITWDGSVDRNGRRAARASTGNWPAGIIILLNQGLATLAFFGVGVNLVLFLTRVLQQDNAKAANSVSKWTGTVYIFSLVGAFLSDSYWGRYKTCAIFQVIFVIGLASLSVSSYMFLLEPKGCGNQETQCSPHSNFQEGMFYMSIYMIALGYGGYQPNIATFGADQFDEDHPKEGHSKVSFFSYFYLVLNLGSLVSNTILGYYENLGMWGLGFWASAGSALAALLLFLSGTPRYRHFKPSGNPFARFCQVIVAAVLKCRATVSHGEEFYESETEDKSVGNSRKILHTNGFRCLDRAAYISSRDSESIRQGRVDPWGLCSLTQVEEVKCILRLIPIWLCTIIYSVVFTQMASLFVEQGAAMKATIGGFHIPPASMSTFDILSVACFIFLYRRVLDPLVRRVRKKGLSELHRMGIGLIIAVGAMVSAGVVECFRLKHALPECPHCEGSSSSLSIFWQVPQYMLIGASEVFMYVGQLEFFNAEAPDALKSFGSALCMTSMSLGNFVSSLLVTVVMRLSTNRDTPGWIPGNLNKGHLERFYFLLAGLTAVDLAVYVICAKLYKSVKMEGRGEDSSSVSSQHISNVV